MATLIQGFGARLTNLPFSVRDFLHSGAQCQSTGKSKTKTCRLASLASNPLVTVPHFGTLGKNGLNAILQRDAIKQNWTICHC